MATATINRVAQTSTSEPEPLARAPTRRTERPDTVTPIARRRCVSRGPFRCARARARCGPCRRACRRGSRAATAPTARTRRCVCAPRRAAARPPLSPARSPPQGRGPESPFLKFIIGGGVTILFELSGASRRWSARCAPRGGWRSGRPGRGGRRPASHPGSRAARARARPPPRASPSAARALAQPALARVLTPPPRTQAGTRSRC